MPLRREPSHQQAAPAPRNSTSRPPLDAPIAAEVSSPDDAIEAAELRIRRESEKKLQHDKRAFLIDFLGVLDNLDRAANAASTAMDTAPLADQRSAAPAVAPVVAPIAEGVQLVRRSFLRTLAKHGVYHAPALGQTFNPDRHEAVSTLDVNDPIDNDRVVAVVREGYRIGDATLRPAQVVVGKDARG